MDCASATLEKEQLLPSSRFDSILFEVAPVSPVSTEPPEFFRDLNLDQIVDAITAGREEYGLKPFFYAPLKDLAAVEYRQEIMRDLEHEQLFQAIKSFSDQMRSMRAHLVAAEKALYKFEKERWFLDAAEIYCEAVDGLLGHLNQIEPGSRGFGTLRSFLQDYTASTRFQRLFQGAKQLQDELGAIRYNVLIKGNSITVGHFLSEADYSAVIEETFAKFKQGEVKDYRAKFNKTSWGLNHIEAQILDRVAQLNPEVFGGLDDYCKENSRFQDQTVTRFDREIQFYLAYHERMGAVKSMELKFCYPQLSNTSKCALSRGGFDLALAEKLLKEKSTVISNDFHLDGKERIFVVTGPNQGGKTTFARTFGQLHYLARLGCPVPGTAAQLFLCDGIYTHFERAEDATSLRGKLESDLLRMRDILEHATPKSVIIINEIFSSTSLKDAVLLGTGILNRISELDALCVCVTFLDELASLNEKTVSLVAAVVPDNPTLRTFKIERKKADGLAHALAIAEKYRLTSKHLQERVKL